MRRAGSVLIVGLGGLGAPAAAVLAAAGVARLGLVDPDQVELSNLPRQPLYAAEDIGSVKVEAAARRLAELAPDLEIEPHCLRLDADTMPRLIQGYDVLLDGTDNFASKVLLNEGSVRSGIPLVHAGVLGLEGQLFTILPDRTACLRCLFAEIPPDDELPSCQEAGVLGPVVGAIGLTAAREALSIASGKEPALAGRLAILEGARLRWRIVELRPNPRCPVCRAAEASRQATP